MHADTRSSSASHRIQVLQQAWPIVVANASIPLLGLVDTAVIGRTGSAAALGALAVSNLVFSFVYWAFGFLRMSTTGFISQARGDKDMAEAQAVWVRSLLLALCGGVLLVALQSPIAAAAFSLLHASSEVEALAREYFAVRIWGAPATLALYGVMGACIGFGRTKLLLMIQLAMNATNMCLDVTLAYGFGMGVAGIATGTVISEWLTLIVALVLLPRLLFTGTKAPMFAPEYFGRSKIMRLFTVNNDMFIRTLFLLGGFAWFTNAAAKFGDVFLASTHVLLMLISFSAFFLDGFAFVAEERVGAAMGAKDWASARGSIYTTSELALVTALLLGLSTFIFGTYGIALLTHSEAVQAQVQAFLPWAVAYIMLSVAAFQLDGIFIGALQSAAMRNASVLAFGLLITSYLFFGERKGEGLWYSFIIFVIARAVFLVAHWSRLTRQFASA